MNRSSKASGTALLLGAGISFGTIPLWVTWMAQDGIGAWAQTSARIGIPVLILVVFVLPFARDSLRIASGRNLRLLILNGLLMLISNVTYISSMTLGTPPTKAILLNQMSPLYVALIGALLLGEKLTRRRLAAVLIGLAGTATLLQVWDIQGMLNFQPGDMLAMVTGVTYATMVVFGRWSGIQEGSHPLKLSFWTFIFALSWLILLALIVSITLGPEVVALQFPRSVSPRTVASAVGLALLGSGVPFTLMYLGLSRTEAGTASILLLSEPVGVFVLSFLWLGQPIDLWQILGGVLVLSAGVLVAR
ncbi:MAG: DMT family transporter [Anaerolineae bacterium]|nr:DMT family transporter [Anaerolineae bacterium]